MQRNLMPAPFIAYTELDPRLPLERDRFPGNLLFTNDLHVEFDSPVTFFVGENGSGKSTLVEAMAVVAQLPINGGGMNEIGDSHGISETSRLANSLKLGFKKQPKDRYFFRAETQAHFATLLDQREVDPDFILPGGAHADPYQRFGGQSLHLMSHGEAFLSIMQNRFRSGLLLMDEPESALSPQRQLALLALMHDLVAAGKTQFFIATHSPILLTFPGATIFSFDSGALQKITLEETSHYQITRGILNEPARYWQHLAKKDLPD